MLLDLTITTCNDQLRSKRRDTFARTSRFWRNVTSVSQLQGTHRQRTWSISYRFQVNKFSSALARFKPTEPCQWSKRQAAPWTTIRPRTTSLTPSSICSPIPMTPSTTSSRPLLANRCRITNRGSSPSHSNRSNWSTYCMSHPGMPWRTYRKTRVILPPLQPSRPPLEPQSITIHTWIGQMHFKH